MSAPANKWLEPSSLLGIAGFVSLMWSGYQQFADSTATEIRQLSERLVAVETKLLIEERAHAR